MNSSTNPPGGSLKKFQFDLDFDVEEERIRLEMLRQQDVARQAETTPEPRIYSEDEYNIATQQAFQNGLTQGHQETKQSLDAVLTSLCERVLQGLHVLLEQDAAREQKLVEMSLRTAASAIKKFWPQFQTQSALDMLDSTLRQTMTLNPDEPRLVLRVHDTLLDGMVNRLPALKNEASFVGKVIVIADETLLPGDCKLEWADGGLERISRHLLQHLDAVIDRLLSGYNATSTIHATTERTSS